MRWVLPFLLLGCSSTMPQHCEVVNGSDCYDSVAEACAAIDCPISRCDSLRTDPAQVMCREVQDVPYE